MYLVDTNVLSVGEPARAATAPGLADWMRLRSSQLFLSVVTIAEVQQGIAKARRDGSVRKAERLSLWLDAVVHLYGERVLPMDVDVARVAGELSDRARAAGRPPGFEDIIIAATAAHHGLTLLTRNTKHFEPLGVAFHDPFDTLP